MLWPNRPAEPIAFRRSSPYKPPHLTRGDWLNRPVLPDERSIRCLERGGGFGSIPAAAEPVKEQGSHGTARFYYAPAARSRRSLRSPETSLEPQDGAVHLRDPQQ